MPAIEDHEFMKLCAQLASLLSISISSARRKVDIAAAKEGKKDLIARKDIAKKLLQIAVSKESENTKSISGHFDELLVALQEEENFMVED